MSKPCCRNSLVVIAAFFLLAASGKTSSPDTNAQEPIVITSNSMKADELGSSVTFMGSVTLKQANMTFSADAMTVLYDAGSKDVREIAAHGNVVVRKEGRVALSNDALYYKSDERIIMTGDARIVENDNQLGGEKIILYMKDDRSFVEGGKVLLYQDKQTKPLEGLKRK